MTDYVSVLTSAPPSELHRALSSGRHVVIHGDSVGATSEIIEALVSTLESPGVGSASPIPVRSLNSAGAHRQHQASPPAPSLALPCRQLCGFSAEALASLPLIADSVVSIDDQIARISERLLQHGWRHVAAPGVAFGWDPAVSTGMQPIAGWNDVSLASLVGPANAGLEAHVSWASAQVDGVRIVVDGVCLTDAPYTGTQHLVLEVTRWLAATRPNSTVMLAVRHKVIAALKSELAGSRVQVVERSTRVEADLVYRPYQMLYARELPFVTTVGRRALVGQLDMIGFSNPFYHPSDQLFFFARNLQRHLMRTLDGVTFISAFGRDSAFTECPDLDVNRLHVVSCGADPKPLPGVLRPDRPLDSTTPFLVCLSSTFWHKNRAHAIATFAALVEVQGYEGHLVLGGPEPYFGRSTDTEDLLIRRLAPDVRSRVHRWGHIDDNEKWWLLRHAQAVLYPSVVEGFGLVPFEAASVGTPCLTYAGTAPGELLVGTGAVINSWSPLAWAVRVSRMIDDVGHASDVVNEIAEVAKLHTWKRCAERTWLAIDQALAAPRRSIHHDDGHHLSRVAPSSQRQAPGAALRFDIARGFPAVGRRLKRARNKVSGRT